MQKRVTGKYRAPDQERLSQKKEVNIKQKPILILNTV
jgi:hypothetical protein